MKVKLFVISILVLFGAYFLSRNNASESHLVVSSEVSRNNEPGQVGLNQPFSIQGHDLKQREPVEKGMTTSTLAAKDKMDGQRVKDEAPDSFVDEVFPKLDTFEWLMQTRDPENKKSWNTVKVRNKLSNKFKIDTFFGRRLKLFLLSPGDSLSLESEQRILEVLGFPNPRVQDPLKVIFKQKQILSVFPESAVNIDVPICVLEVNFSGGTSNREGMDMQIVKVDFPIETFPGFSGVRLILRSIKEPRWLNSIECYVKKVSGDEYKELAVVHLLSTIGIHGDAEKF